MRVAHAGWFRGPEVMTGLSTSTCWNCKSVRESSNKGKKRTAKNTHWASVWGKNLSLHVVSGAPHFAQCDMAQSGMRTNYSHLKKEYWWGFLCIRQDGAWGWETYWALKRTPTYWALKKKHVITDSWSAQKRLILSIKRIIRVWENRYEAWCCFWTWEVKMWHCKDWYKVWNIYIYWQMIK